MPTERERMLGELEHAIAEMELASGVDPYWHNAARTFFESMHALIAQIPECPPDIDGDSVGPDQNQSLFPFLEGEDECDSSAG